MHFAWILVPLLLAPLNRHAADPLPGGSPVADRHPEYALATTDLPVALLPSGTTKLEVGQGSCKVSERDRTGPQPTTGEGIQRRSTAHLLVRLRTLCRAGLDFTPDLTRRFTGFLSSHTTACPPPSAE